METKGCLSAEIKDQDSGIVHAIVARTDDVDRDGDVFLKNAFGTQSVRVSAFNHKSWPNRGGERPVGRGTIREIGAEVHAELKFFLTTSAGRDEFNTVKELDDLAQWSYGFLPATAKMGEMPDHLRALGGKRAYASVEVVEVSPVLLAASNGTRTVTAKEEGRALLVEARKVLESIAEAEATLSAAELREERRRLRANLADVPGGAASFMRALKAADGDASRIRLGTPGGNAPSGTVVIDPRGRVFHCNHRRVTDSWHEVL